MSSKLTKRVKLPEEESNGNKSKGKDHKDETSSTPERVEERTKIPEFFARSKESFNYYEKEETIFRMQEKIDEYEKHIQIAKETIKEQEDDKIEAIKKITESLPRTPGQNLMKQRCQKIGRAFRYA
jgi:hypothetical protein